MDCYQNIIQSGAPTVMGIDPSLTSTGIAVISGGSLYVQNITTKAKGMGRLAFLRDTIMDRVEITKPDIIMLEGYSFASRGRGTFSLGELGGVLRLALYEADQPVHVLSPNSLKLFVTGKGNANKTAVSLALMKRWKVELDQEDQADATGLALAAAYHLMPALEPTVPEAQLKALEKSEVLGAVESPK